MIEQLAPEPGVRWLDLACGTGAVAELAAQAGAIVTGIDLAPALIDTARERAGEQGLEIDYRVGDCEQLDVPDARSSSSATPSSSTSRSTARRCAFRPARPTGSRSRTRASTC